MGVDETAPKKRKMPYIPHDLVSSIMALLPVKSLMRFKCVCKAWHDTISGDPAFHRAHLRLQDPCVLIAPQIKTCSIIEVASPGLYRWDERQRTATLVQAMDSFPPACMKHKLAHCDGLVLVPMEDTVRVLNPATRKALTLPRTRYPRRFDTQAFGLGHDPRSNTYKIARLFYRSMDSLETGGYHCSVGVEVFTIGKDQDWRETAATPPPYPVIAGRTATFFKGSLLWIIDQHLLAESVHVRGFIRFSLEDESFSVMPAPPGCPELTDSASSLANLNGELWLAHKGPAPPPPFFHSGPVWMWMYSDLDDANPPRWDRRHVLDFTPWIRLIDAVDNRILCQTGSYSLSSYDCQTKPEGVKHVVAMYDLKYHHPNTNTLVEYPIRTLHAYDVISYVPSLIPI